MTADARVLVCIPTYNERESLPTTLDRLREAAPAVDVLVVDDGSPDGTGDYADDRAAEDDRVHVLHRQGKNGLGAAYLAAFDWALQRDYDVVCEMDADGSHAPEDVTRLLDAVAAGADLALGSRWVPGGRVTNWPLSRRVLSRGGNLYTRIVLGLPVRDATGGFRAFRASALRRLDLAGVASAGYCFQVDLTWRLVRAGLTAVEVPIVFVERVAGESKMSRSIVVEALWRVTVWGATWRWQQATAAVRRLRPKR